MPFPIWCTTCPKPTIIGQGVRFNVEKKKVGNYHTTPIYSFRMKHNVCGGAIEIRTDPKNTAYVVTEGAKKRDTGEDKVQEGDIVIRTEEERERLQSDAFAALEQTIETKKQGLNDKSRIEELYGAKEKSWEDPYAASKKLRRAFRADRKIRKQNEAATESLKDRMSLGMEILGESEEDRRRAALVDFGDLGVETTIGKAAARPLFSHGLGPSKEHHPKGKTLKNKASVKPMVEKLREEVGNNTRAAMDPFLTQDRGSNASSSQLSLIKRSESRDAAPVGASGSTAPTSLTLVDYDSD